MLHHLVRSLCMLALACGALSHSGAASAAGPADIIIRERLSELCRNDRVHPVIQYTLESNASHQYMLLLVFKKGTGSRYFGKPAPSQYGCIADARGQTDSAGKWQAIATGNQLVSPTCPNDCVYPYGQHEAPSDGNDPLGPNRWGIVSAINSDRPGGGPGRHVEIWQIAVIDACHARSLYAYHTATRDSLFEVAYAAGDMLGEILVGYKNGKNVTAYPECRYPGGDAG